MARIMQYGETMVDMDRVVAAKEFDRSYCGRGRGVEVTFDYGGMVEIWYTSLEDFRRAWQGA